MTQRIAVVVDGDNISAVHADTIMAEARKLGRVDLARVYGNAVRPCDWQIKAGFRMIHAGCGKNAADVLLCIDAMELALTGHWDGFVIASSDGDFVHLAQRLRERGLHVSGIGECKAPPAYQAACTSFIAIGPATTSADNTVQPIAGPEAGPPTAKQADAATAQNASAIDRKIRGIIGIAHGDARGMPITTLSQTMFAKHGFKISSTPEKKWRPYLEARQSLFVVAGLGTDARVQNKMREAGAHRISMRIAAE